jgi:hypothetical protein
MKNNIIDLTGKKFGMLTVINFSFKTKHSHFAWYCKCDCGNYKNIYATNLINGKTKSCGCLQKKMTSLKNGTHRLRKHPLYTKWIGMRERCYYEKCDSYKLYGAIGVTVCDEWKNDFMAFYNWAIKNGWKDGLQLDKDKKALELNVKPMIYSPEFCSFLSPRENSNNRKTNRILKHNGEELTISKWAEKLNINKSTIATRIHRGWSDSRALGF